MFHALFLTVLTQCGPSHHRAPPPTGPRSRAASRLNTIWRTREQTEPAAHLSRPDLCRLLH